MKKLPLCTIICFTSFSHVASAVLLASFDLGDSVAPTDPSSPVAGPAGTPTTWDVIHGTNFNSPPTQNGIQFFVYNGTSFIDSRGGLNDLLSDVVYENNGGDGANWRLEGLTSGIDYQVYFIAADGSGFGATNLYNTKFSAYDADPGINGSNAGSVNLLDSVDVNPVDQGSGFSGTWVDGVTHGILEFTANSSTMYGTWDKLPAGSHSGFGAVQVVQVDNVPEPSTSMLTLVAGLALLARRRR